MSDTNITDGGSRGPNFPQEDFRGMATAFSQVSGVLGGFCITILVLVLSRDFFNNKPIEIINWVIGLLLVGASLYIASAGILANSMNAILFKDINIRVGFFQNSIVLFHLANLFLVASISVLVFNVLSDVLWGLKITIIFIDVVVSIIALVNVVGGIIGGMSRVV